MLGFGMRFLHRVLFPAFLPLLEIVPWVLSLLGATAALSAFFNGPFWKAWRWAIIAFIILTFGGAGGLYHFKNRIPDIAHSGSEAVAVQDLPPVIPAESAPVDRKPIAKPSAFGPIWSVVTKEQVLSTPVVSHGLVLYGSYKGSLEALAIESGAPLWSIPVSDFVFSITAIGERVYISEGLHESTNSGFTAVDLNEPRVLWQRRFYGHLEDSVATDGRSLWFSAGPGGLWALRADDGKPLWQARIGHMDSRPLFLDGRLYVSAWPDETMPQSYFHAIDANSGKTLWKQPVSGQPWGSAITDEKQSIVFTSSGIGQIGVNRKTDAGWAQAFAKNGQRLWQVPLSSMPLQPLAYVPEIGAVIVTIKSGDVVALDHRDGHTVWQTKIGSDIQAAGHLFNLAGRAVYAVTSADGVFALINAVDGKILKSFKVDRHCTSSPVVDDNILYVSTARRITAYGGLDALAKVFWP